MVKKIHPTAVIAPGAELRTNGVRVYYQSLSLLGNVDQIGNLVPISGATCSADFDADNLVGPRDLAVVLAAWGQSGVEADLDGSGTVGAGDLAIVLASWGDCL